MGSVSYLVGVKGYGFQGVGKGLAGYVDLVGSPRWVWFIGRHDRRHRTEVYKGPRPEASIVQSHCVLKPSNCLLG